MTAWIAVAAFASVLVLLLLRGRDGDIAALFAVATAVAIGFAGYGVAGRPSLPAAPAERTAADVRVRTAFEAERQARLGRFGETAAWLTFSDALLRADASEMAVRGLRSQIDRRADDAELWIGLGNALAMHAGEVGPASALAFAQAARLAPASGEPRFFLGLAQLETGDARGAARTWRALAARSLPNKGLERWIVEAEARAVGQP